MAFNTPTYSDFVIATKDDKLYVHRVILDTIPYFRRLFKAPRKEPACLRLSKRSFALAWKLLLFLYCGEIETASLTFKDWIDLITLAYKWGYVEFIHYYINDISAMMTLENLTILSYLPFYSYFVRDLYFQKQVLPLLTQYPYLPDILWDLIAHPNYPLAEVIKTERRYFIKHWLKTHQLTYEDVRDLRFDDMQKYPELNQAINELIFDGNKSLDEEDEFPDSP